jgi:hypothetical protein
VWDPARESSSDPFHVVAEPAAEITEVRFVLRPPREEP